LRFVDPGSLNGFEYLLSAALRVVGKLCQLDYPAMQLDEIHVTGIDIRLAFGELDGDFENINPFQANAGAS